MKFIFLGNYSNAGLEGFIKNPSQDRKSVISSMMEKAGLERIQFSENMPFWCAVGFRK